MAKLLSRIAIAALLAVILCDVARPRGGESPADELTEGLARIEALQKTLNVVGLDLEKVRAEIGAPSLTERNRADWKAALDARHDLLLQLGQAREERNQLRSMAAIEEMRTTARTARDTLRASTPVPPGQEVDAAELAGYEERLRQARARVDLAAETLKTRQDGLKAREAELRILVDREAKANQTIESSEAAPDDILAGFRVESARIDLLVVAEQRTYCEEAKARWPVLVTVREIELETARLELESARRQMDLAGEAHRRLRDRLAREAAERAARAKEEAERTLDPISRFRQTATAEREQTEERENEEGGRLTKVARTVGDQEQVNLRFVRELQQLKQRFEIGGAAAGRTAEVLLLTWDRVKENQRVLRRRTLPDHYGTVERYMSLRADVQDRIWALQLPLEEGPRDWQRFLADVPQERREEARAACEQARAALLPALETRRRGLDALLAKLAELSNLYAGRLDILESLYAYVVQRIYWVRTETPIGVTTIAAVPAELGRLATLYADAPFRRGVADAYAASPARFLVSGAGLLGLLVASGLLNHRLRRYRTRWSYRGSTVLVFLQRLGVSLLLSGLAPACLLLAIPALSWTGLPDLLAGPGERVFAALAVILFARRFLWAFFRDGGIATTELKTPPAVAAQLLRASRRTTTVAAAFFLPWWILAGEPIGLIHLPRLLYAALLLAGAWILIGLLNRRRPLLVAMVGEKGFWHRAWFFLHLIVSLGLLAIVAMDVLGYRFGSGLLTKNVIQTFVAALVLMGAYNFITRLVDGASRKLRQRRRGEDIEKEEIEKTREAISQLTRFAGLVVVVVAVFLMADFWGVLAQIKSFCRAVVIATIDADADRFLTLLDLIGALLWILGGHVLVKNLAGLLEVVIFPKLDNLDRGSRFVILRITRYLVLVIAYSAALLSLQISFTSLGWLLAAASFGLGFGLQEIISNFVSGLILLIERPVRVGDIINVGQTAGTVQQINIRATTIENWDRQLMIIPNRKFITEDVINWTRNDDIIRTALDIGVAYGSDTEKVIRILMETVRANPTVLEEPPPRVLFLKFGESSLDFKVWYFTKIPDRMPTTSAMQEQIAKRFAEEGITIPFPQRDLWLRSGDDTDMLTSVLGKASGPTATGEGSSPSSA